MFTVLRDLIQTNLIFIPQIVFLKKFNSGFRLTKFSYKFSLLRKTGVKIQKSLIFLEPISFAFFLQKCLLSSESNGMSIRLEQ